MAMGSKINSIHFLYISISNVYFKTEQEFIPSINIISEINFIFVCKNQNSIVNCELGSAEDLLCRNLFPPTLLVPSLLQRQTTEFVTFACVLLSRPVGLF